MDIYFLCPKCETKFAIDESGAGMIFRCTNCNQKIVVPEPSKPAPVVPKVVTPPAPAPIAPPPPVALSPAVTPVAPTPPAPPPQPKTKTQKIPESQLPQQQTPAAAPTAPPTTPARPTQKVIVPKISTELPPPTPPTPPPPAPKPETPVAPSAIQLLRDAQTNLEKQLAERSAALAAANQQIESLQRDLQQKSSILEEKLAASQRDLEARNKELQETESAARAAREEAAKTVESLKLQLAEARAASANTQNQIAQLQTALQSAPKSDALISLQRDLAAHQQRISELERYEQLSHELQNQTRELKTELAEREKKLVEQQQAFSNLQSQIAQIQEANQKRHSEAEARVVALATEKAELERRLESQESHLRQLETLAAQAPAASDLMRLQEELRQRAAEIADLRHANEELAASHHAQLTETQEQLAALQRQLEQSLFTAAEQAQRAQTQIQSLQSAAEQQRATFDEERARFSQQLSDALNQAKQLEAQLANRETLLASANEQAKRAQTEIQSLTAASQEERAQLSQLLHAAQSHAQQLEAQLADRDKMLAAAAMTGDQRFKQAQEDLRAVREQSQQQLAALEEQVASLQQQLSAAHAQLKTAQSQLVEKEQALSVSADDALKKSQQHAAAVESLQRETAHKLAEIADEKSRLAAQWHDATQELESLRSQLSATPSSDEVKTLRASLDAALKEKAALAEKLTSLDESARATSADLSAKLKRALDEKAEVQSRLRSVEADLAIAREQLLFFERNPAPPAQQESPEIAQPEKPAADSFPPPAPIFSFSGDADSPALAPENIPDVDDLKSATPPPLRFKTASEKSGRPALPDSRPAVHGNGDSHVAVAEKPAATSPQLGEIPNYTPRSSARPTRRLMLLFLVLALAFVGIGFLLWFQFAGYSTYVNVSKFDPVFASFTRLDDHTRIGPQPIPFAELLKQLDADVDEAMKKSDRGNERRLAEDLKRIVGTYKDSQTLWDLTRQNNNIAPVTDERVRALAQNYSLRRFRIPNRDEEFVDGREGVPRIWDRARQQVNEAKEFARSHQAQQ
jgi:predicted Zn finger-like uncharacterized protein